VKKLSLTRRCQWMPLPVNVCSRIIISPVLQVQAVWVFCFISIQYCFNRKITSELNRVKTGLGESYIESIWEIGGNTVLL